MPKSYEQISNHNSSSQGKPDANLANDSNHLGGIPAEDYATKEYVQEYHQTKENALKQYIDNQDASTLNSAKAYTNAAIQGQDFSAFAKLTDVQALDKKLTENLNTGLNNQKNYTDSKVTQLNQSISTINNNLKNIDNSIEQLDDNMQEVFQSVSSGKAELAEAITDKGVSTSATASFDTMANNIRNIETGGGEIIPPGYVDTSDGTATANDILSGKIAYVDGKKIYGSLNFTGSNTPEYNPNNPYPELAQVELVYGDKESVASVTNLGNIRYTVFDISSDRNLLVGYNEDTHKIETMFRVGDQYMKSYNQHGTLLSPEYTLENLGITTDSDYTLSAIKMSCLNTKTTASAYECKIAILLSKTATVEKKNFICYVFKISTKDGTIKATNNVVQIGDDNCIEYNKWIIEGARETVTTAINILSNGKVFLDYYYNSFLRWSPFSDTLAIVIGQSKPYIYLYRFLDYTNGATEDYSTAIQLKDSFSEAYSIAALDFCSNDKIVLLRQNNGSTQYIRVYSSNFSFIKQNDLSSIYAISYDGLYSFYQKNISSLTIDYVNGNITKTSLKDFEDMFFKAPYGRCFNSQNNDTFVSIENKTSVIGNPYYLYVTKINWETLEVSETYAGSTRFNYLFPLSDLKSFVALTNAGLVHLVETIPSGKELIGVKYNGETFYKQIYRSGSLSATNADVATGKTFIGYQGVPETGIAQIISSSNEEE
jgi:hypothetical protein